jgi:EmrB/QacA subfamily drug resistance transporter
VLAASVLGSGMVGLDATVVNIAMPTLARELGGSMAGLQWISAAYTLTLAGFMLLGGALGDRYGQKRIFIIGVVWFAASSLLCGIAPSIEMLIAGRAIQGIGGALVAPGSLALIQSSFHPDDRGQAIGAWSGLGGLATAIGPFVGGWLIQSVSWRFVFFINLPLAALSIVIVARHLPRAERPPIHGPLDWRGLVLAVVGLGGFCYGFIEGPGRGFGSPVVLGSFAASVVAWILFVHVERRHPAPMVDLGIFRSRLFVSANLITFVVYAALSGALFLLPMELQTVAGYTPLQAGMALLPITLLMLVLSPRAGRLSQEIGPRILMTVGPLVAGLGLALLWRIDTGGYVVEILPAVLVLGFGVSLNVAPLTATVMAAAPTSQAGLASAINVAVARAAGLIAVAVLPAIAGIGGGSITPAAFGAGFRRAIVASAILCAAGGVMAWLVIRRRPAQANEKEGEKLDGAIGRPRPHGPVHCAIESPPLR